MASINLNMKERVWTPNGKMREEPYEDEKCPRCNGQLPVGYPGAISRTDNKTEVCSDCGVEEAMVQFFKGMAKRGDAEG